jgi:hypothetical protein
VALLNQALMQVADTSLPSLMILVEKTWAYILKEKSQEFEVFNVFNVLFGNNLVA